MAESEPKLKQELVECFEQQRQVISYGAPGTGKSYSINKFFKETDVKEENQFRTIFHPDSDYSTFVGAYKPTMEGDEIKYKFVPQVFLKAYVRAYQTKEKVYLVIEEINRGNCAQIFGDIFQLLDRKDDGYSEYSINADDDILKYLEEVLGKDHEGIKGGKLCLPSNLYIYATMNTSDQSLFPIDSAFKRRWYWMYSPIKYENENWIIKIDNIHTYSWTSFQKVVNRKIFDATNSEDKMLGDFFVKPNGNEISEEMFRDKILFYLWNDVCKDGSGDIFVIKADNETETDNKTKKVSFSDFYMDGGDKKLIAIMEHLGVKLVLDKDKDGNANKTSYKIIDESNEKEEEPGTLRGIVYRAVEMYVEEHKDATPEQIKNAWNEKGFTIRHIIETEEDMNSRTKDDNGVDKDSNKRCKLLKLPNDKGNIYVSTEVSGSGDFDNFSDFKEKITDLVPNIKIVPIQ